MGLCAVAVPVVCLVIRRRSAELMKSPLSIEGDDNVVEQNIINEAPCGIFFAGTGNTLPGNTTSNTELATCEPFTLSFKALSLNSRAGAAMSSGFAFGGLSAITTDAAGLALRAATPAR